jgi:hypothetical protein
MNFQRHSSLILVLAMVPLTLTAAATVSLAQSHGPAVEAMNSLDPVIAKQSRRMLLAV